MATKNKTRPTKKSVVQFLNAIPDPQKRKDAKTILRIMKDATGEKPVMWGPNIVGFGTFHYRYASGREGDFLLVGFSPRKQNLTLYIISGFKNYTALLKKLGPHKAGKSCLYLRRLRDIDIRVLKTLIARSVAEMKKRYPTH